MIGGYLPEAYRIPPSVGVGDTLGLFLLVQPSGGKLWRVKYRIDGKEKKLAIGIYPQVGLAEARRRRDAARELVAAGKDLQLANSIPSPLGVF